MAEDGTEATVITEEAPTQIEGLPVEELQEMYNAKVAEEAGQTDEQSEPTTEGIENESTENPEVNAEPDTAEEPATEAKKEEVTIEALQKQLEGMQKIFARSQTDYGENKKLMQQMLAQNQAQAEPEEEVDFYTDPDKFLEQKVNQKLDAHNQANLQQQQVLDTTKGIVNGYYTDFEDHVDVISSRIKEFLGDDPSADIQAQSFKDNPYSTDAWTLLFAADSAKKEREITDLQKKLQAAQQGQGKLVQNIKKFNGQRPTVSGNSGQASGDAQIQLSRAQIEELGTNGDIGKLEELYKQAMNK